MMVVAEDDLFSCERLMAWPSTNDMNGVQGRTTNLRLDMVRRHFIVQAEFPPPLQCLLQAVNRCLRVLPLHCPTVSV